jgi:hypothetical protein
MHQGNFVRREQVVREIGEIASDPGGKELAEIGDTIGVGEFSHGLPEQQAPLRHQLREHVERPRLRLRGRVLPLGDSDRQVAAAGDAPPQRLASHRLVDQGFGAGIRK